MPPVTTRVYKVVLWGGITRFPSSSPFSCLNLGFSVGLSPVRFVQQLVFRGDAPSLSLSPPTPTAISSEVGGGRAGTAAGERGGRAVVVRMMMPVDLLFLPSFRPLFASDESAKINLAAGSQQPAETATPNIQPAVCLCRFEMHG